VRVRAIVEIVQGTAGDQVFAAAFATREEEGDVGDLFGQDVYCAIDPDDLLVGVAEEGAAGVDGFAAQPGDGGGGKLGNRCLRWRRWGGTAGDLEAEEIHGGNGVVGWWSGGVMEQRDRQSGRQSGATK
jgi:hypothetical protein